MEENCGMCSNLLLDIYVDLDNVYERYCGLVAQLCITPLPPISSLISH